MGQHPEGVDAAPGAAPPWRHADLRQDPYGQDRDARGRAVRLDRERQGQDPGQGGHPSRSAASDLCWQAARGRPHSVGLQHPEGVDAAPGAASARRQLASRASALCLPSVCRCRIACGVRVQIKYSSSVKKKKPPPKKKKKKKKKKK